LTEYGLGISIGSLALPTGSAPLASVNLAPPLTYIRWTPECRNQLLAPKPLSPSAPGFVGIWGGLGVPYAKDNIVSLLTPSTQETLYFKAIQNVPIIPDPAFGSPVLSNTNYWISVSSSLGRAQDVSTRYYWLDTFQHWVGLVNEALTQANNALYTEWNSARIANGNVASPYTGFSTGGTPWTGVYPTPVCSYDIPSGLFSILYPAIYKTAQPIFENPYNGTPPAPNTQPTLWFNQNLEGLLSNFYNLYYNSPQGDGSLLSGTPKDFPEGYVYKMLVVNEQNLAGIITQTQEAQSTSTLWSPIESLVFISNLLPIQNEQVAPPNTYGTGNIGNSTATAQSAFQPIITDIANDLALDPFAYRKMIYYAPSAQYRMADFKNSKQEIKTIDVQVFWKNRLNNQLYPLTMYNLSSVSIKILFRKKTVLMKDERTTLY
jgi:hypothetical protein